MDPTWDSQQSCVKIMRFKKTDDVHYRNCVFAKTRRFCVTMCGVWCCCGVIHRALGQWSLKKNTCFNCLPQNPISHTNFLPILVGKLDLQKQHATTVCRRDPHNGDYPPLFTFYHSAVQNAPVVSLIVGPRENQMRFGVSTWSSIHVSFVLLERVSTDRTSIISAKTTSPKPSP